MAVTLDEIKNLIDSSLPSDDKAKKIEHWIDTANVDGHEQGYNQGYAEASDED